MNCKNTELYTGRAENYVAFRPSYPKVVVDEIYKRIGITTQSIIADIGAGTGKFTRLLLERGNIVHAVEPNKDMYQMAISELYVYTGFIPHNATAEETGLSDKSIDVITAAQAFSKFNKELCKKEFIRILKPDGKVVIIWYESSKNSAFMIEHDEILQELLPNYKNAVSPLRKMQKEQYFHQFFKNGEYDTIRYPWSSTATWESFFGATISASWAPLEGELLYQPLKEQLQAVFNLHALDGKVEYHYETVALIGSISD